MNVSAEKESHCLSFFAKTVCEVQVHNLFQWFVPAKDLSPIFQGHEWALSMRD